MWYLSMTDISVHADGYLQFIELGTTVGVSTELVPQNGRVVEVTSGLAFGNSSQTSIYVSTNDGVLQTDPQCTLSLYIFVVIII